MADSHSKDIYGADPECGAAAIANEALKSSGHSLDEKSETDSRVSTKIAKGK
jgi:hypothetical protein